VLHLSVTLDLATDATSAGHMLADPRYVEQKVVASGAIEHQVDVTGTADEAFTVATRRALPSDQIPAQVRGFVGNRIDVRLVEAWEAPQPDGGRAGTVVVEIAGAPVRLTGRCSLQPVGPAASRLVYDGDLQAQIPLFGSAVEEAAARAIRGALGVEQQVAERWIADHGRAEQP
jgi:hypothetical protein